MKDKKFKYAKLETASHGKLKDNKVSFYNKNGTLLAVMSLGDFGVLLKDIANTLLEK